MPLSVSDPGSMTGDIKISAANRRGGNAGLQIEQLVFDFKKLSGKATLPDDAHQCSGL
jgi:hypothetical protein